MPSAARPTVISSAVNGTVERVPEPSSMTSFIRRLAYRARCSRRENRVPSFSGRTTNWSIS